jgi:23S rRNA pseudouridine2604 synthase
MVRTVQEEMRTEQREQRQQQMQQVQAQAQAERAERGGRPPAPPPPARPARAPAPASEAGTMRLSKRMSELGIASRREADEWIAKGWVRVDGRVVAELGSRVTPDQHITVDARASRQQAQRVTILLNKPVGYVSGQAEDGYEPAVVLVTPQNQWRGDTSGIRFAREHLRTLAPAGRLDIDSVGLLVLTQDGRIAKQLIGEASDVEKEYLVRVEGRLSDDGLALLEHGLSLDGEPLRPAKVEWLNADQLRFVLKEGKKRQIRRMCEAVGLKVVGLKRVRIGGVMLGDLPPGQWRYLRGDERFGD